MSASLIFFCRRLMGRDMDTNNRTVWGVSSICLSQARMRPGTCLVSALIWMAALTCHAVTIPFVGTGSMTTNRYYHTATLLLDGRVLVSGGHDAVAYLKSAELYNPSNGSWTATGSMTTNRYEHTATLLPNGKVLVVGGLGTGGELSSAEIYNPSNGTWTVTGSLGTGRESHTATLLPDGRVLVAGGSGPINNLSSSELYNPSNGTWTATGSMTANRDNHTATMLPNGKVLVSGGYGAGGALSSAELYNPSNGLWTATAAMVSNRYWHTATLLPDGKVLVAGGYDPEVSALSSAEHYNPSNGSWTVKGAMMAKRYVHTATLLPDGKVLVAGGSYALDPYISSSELYSLSNGTWTATGSLGTGRRYHTATRLPNGKVLVAGGSGRNGHLKSAELYGCAVTLDAAEETASSVAKIYYSGSDTYGALTTPVRMGYGFSGWWTGPEGTGTQVTEATALVQGTDHTLYAKWTMALTSQGTPHLWLSQYGLVTGEDYEAAELTDTDSDGHLAWQEYVAGSNPTNHESTFTTLISVSNGIRRVSWTPDLGTARVYTVNGRTNLTEGVWGVTNSGSWFFRTRVDMP